MEPPTARAASASTPRRRLLLATSLIGAIVGAVFLVTLSGANQAARGERVLPLLDAPISFVRSVGRPSVVWLILHKADVAWAATGVAGFIAVLGLFLGRRRSLPILLVAAATALAAWGQTYLLDGEIAIGTAHYLGGVACALALGAWFPLARLPSFPRLPQPRGAASNPRTGEPVEKDPAAIPPWTPPFAWECVIVLALTLVALLLRAYALTELPSAFDLEMIESMIQSRTALGIEQYFDETFLNTAPGMVHILTQNVLFRIFGASVFSLRVSALVWGVAAVPLFYWYMRRIAGSGPAIATTLLFVTAPEQLAWSRTENSFFAPVTVLALVSAHLGMWMVTRLSFRATAANALWMPFCRYFYTPSFIMFVYPLVLFGHALVFVRGAWRKLWYVLPLLAAGVALWVFSLSFIHSYRTGGPWRFVNPTIVYGAPAWRKHGENSFRKADVGELIRLQTGLAVEHMGGVIEGLTVDGPQMFSHWFPRYHLFPQHRTLLNLGLTVVFVLGCGYLAGQLSDRRAFALLSLLALGLLPGVMSNQASGRRLALIFPAVYLIGGVMLAATVRLIRERAGPWLSRLAAALLAVVGAGICWSSLVSHFLMDIAPAAYGDQIRFTRPLFQNSDAIFTDLEEPGWRKIQLFGNLDRFLERHPCYRYVQPREWQEAALSPSCNFDDRAFRLTTTPERIAGLRETFAPKRISYLLGQTPSGLHRQQLLQELYPSAEVRELTTPTGQTTMVAITVEASDVQALHSPSLSPAATEEDVSNLLEGLLSGVSLTPASATGDGYFSLRGGILVENDGWYQFGILPRCNNATLTINGTLFPAATPLAMLAGVHPFEMRLLDPRTCEIPLHITIQPHDGGPRQIPADALVRENVASLPTVRAPSVVTYPGFGAARILTQLEGHPEDGGIDANGTLSVLVWNQEHGWMVQQIDRAGNTHTPWKAGLEHPHGLIVVGQDGTHILISETNVRLTTTGGDEIASWKISLGEVPTGAALWQDELLLLVMPSRHSIAMFTLQGELIREFRNFTGGPGRFDRPVSVATNPDGDIVVIQFDGVALLFRSPSSNWEPEFERAFRLDFARLPAETRGALFDGETLLVPDRAAPGPLVYTRDGSRMLATDASTDLGSRGFGSIAALAESSESLYVLDRHRSAVWRIARPLAPLNSAKARVAPARRSPSADAPEP